MTFLHSAHDIERPEWLPSRPLIAVIAVLWVVAVAAQGLSWLSH